MWGSAKANLEVILSPECVTMRFCKVHGSKDMHRYTKRSDGQPDPAVLWPKVYQSQGGMCPSEGLASWYTCPAILRCIPRSRIARMEFSLSLPLQDNVESVCYQLITPTNSGGELLCSTSFAPQPKLDIVTHFQLQPFL